MTDGHGLRAGNVFRAEDIRQIEGAVKLPLRPEIAPERGQEGERQRLEVRSRMAREAEARIGAAREQAGAVRARAEAEAGRLVEEARAQAQAIVTGARAQQGRIEEEARQKGLEAARKEARAEALAQVESALAVLGTSAGGVRGEKERFLRAGLETMLALVTAVLERLVRGRIEVDHDLVRRTLDAAVAHVSGADRITVRIHPDDLGTVEDLRAEILRRIESLTDVSIQTDHGLTRGGVIIETDFGRVDARLETQMAELLREARLVAQTISAEELGIGPGEEGGGDAGLPGGARE